MNPALFLVHLCDGAELIRFRLCQGVNVLGRAPHAHILLADWSVSRRHAELQVRGGRVNVRDLQSTNGTFIDDNRIEASTVLPGQRIRFGEVGLVLAAEQSNAVSQAGLDASDTRCPIKSAAPASSANLSPAQRRVLKSILKGLTEKEAATELGLSEHTVHHHVQSIYVALQVHNRSELFRYLLSQDGNTVSLQRGDTDG